MRLIRSFATVSGFTLLSRVMGFTRDILIASALGAGPIADAFFVAFRFPNMFRNLFAEGAFNAAFVPVFAEMLERGGQTAARLFAEQILSILLSVLVLFTFAVEASMPAFIALVAPGFTEDPETFDTAVLYTRLTLPFLLFVAVSAMFSGIMNSLYRFAAAAGAPLMLNVVLLTVLFAAWPDRRTVGEALAVGVAIGGVCQFLLLFWACDRAGMSLRLPRPRLTPDVKRVLRLMLPGMVGAGAAQINLVVGTALASILGTGAISNLYYAERVNWLPVGVVGVALGTALLPRISRLLQAGDAIGAMTTQNRAVELTLLFGLPAAAGLIVIADPIMHVLYVRGAYTSADATVAAGALGAFALGLPAYLLARVFAPAFFARQDTTTPVRIAIVGVVVNIGVSALLMWPLGAIGIAAGNAAAAWTSAALLWLILHRRGFYRIDERLAGRGCRIAVSAIGMGAGLYFAAPFAAPYLSGPFGVKILALAALVAGGAGLYGGIAIAIGAARLGDLRTALQPRTGPPAS